MSEIEASYGKRVRTQMPDWVKFVLAGLIPVMGGAVGYGQLKAEVVSLQSRLERAEVQADRDKADTKEMINGLQNSLGQVQLNLARVCVKLNAGCKE